MVANGPEENRWVHFEMKRMRDAANQMSREQALDLLVQASRLLMIKTNVIRDLGK